LVGALELHLAGRSELETLRRSLFRLQFHIDLRILKNLPDAHPHESRGGNRPKRPEAFEYGLQEALTYFRNQSAVKGLGTPWKPIFTQFLSPKWIPVSRVLPLESRASPRLACSQAS